MACGPQNRPINLNYLDIFKLIFYPKLNWTQGSAFLGKINYNRFSLKMFDSNLRSLPWRSTYNLANMLLSQWNQILLVLHCIEYAALVRLPN